MGNCLKAIMLDAQILQNGTVSSDFISNMDLGLLTTVIGLVIVFAILIIIALLLAIFSVLVKDRKKPEVQQQTSQAVMPAKATAGTSADVMDDKELVAVITAAIAASMNTSADTLVVRRIKRAGSWNKEAIEEQQNSIY